MADASKKTTKQSLIDDLLAHSDGPPTVVEICDQVGGNYTLASAEIVRRTGHTLTLMSLRAWHRRALEAREDG